MCSKETKFSLYFLALLRKVTSANTKVRLKVTFWKLNQTYMRWDFADNPAPGIIIPRFYSSESILPITHLTSGSYVPSLNDLLLKRASKSIKV